MNVPLYEFSNAVPGRPRRKWWIAVVACPLVAAAVWGIVVLERMGAEARARESFKLETGFHNNVISATARVPAVQPESFEFLSQYPRLQKIDLSGTRTVAGGVRSLLQIDDLRVLDLRDCPWVDDEQAEWLAELKGLKRLDLSGTRVTDAGLRAVSALPRLRDLEIEGCQAITDAGLEACAGMPQLRELWPGGVGYSIDGLFALRERRRDLNLQLQPSDLAGRSRRDSESAVPVVADPALQSFVETGWDFQTSPSAQPGVKMTLSTAADVGALSDLLRFPQDWNMSGHDDRIPLRNIREVQKSNYEEHIAEKWKVLDLHGPAAGTSLAKIFPLTPKLDDLRLQDTTISTDQFPFELVPPGLRRLSIENTPISASFLRLLSQHAALEQLSLSEVIVVGIEPAEEIDAPADSFPVELVLPGLRSLRIVNTAVSPSFLRDLSQQHTALKELRLTDVDADGVDAAELTTEDATSVQYMDVSDISHRYGSDERGTYVQLQGPVAGRSLAKVLALTPPLIVLNLQEMTIAADQFPFERVSSELRRLTIANATINESFLRVLGQHSALEELSLANVVIDGSDVLEETTIRVEDYPRDRWFPGLHSLSVADMAVSESFLRVLSQHDALESLSLRNVALLGADDTDPALGHFNSLRWLQLTEVTVDGVAITDPALKSLVRRLREQLPHVSINVYTTSEDGTYLQSHDLDELTLDPR